MSRTVRKSRFYLDMIGQWRERLMDLACFGAGEKSRYVRRLILRHSNHRVLYYVEDQRFEKIGTKIDDMDVISVCADFSVRHTYCGSL